MLVMAAVAIYNFAEQDASLRRLDTAVFERLRLAMEARDGVTLFQAGLSDFTSLAVNETDDVKHKQIAETLLRQADTTAELVQRLAAHAGDASDGPVEEIVKAFKVYKEGALPVIEMAQSNGSYAVMLMGDVSLLEAAPAAGGLRHGTRGAAPGGRLRAARPDVGGAAEFPASARWRCSFLRCCGLFHRAHDIAPGHDSDARYGCAGGRPDEC
jgi:hypothetical protein